jgi:inhibitor of KinA sporulation pathway (predicted exonuclease)
MSHLKSEEESFVMRVDHIQKGNNMSTPKFINVVDIEACCWENLPPNNFPEQRNEMLEIGIIQIDIATKELGEAEGILIIPPTCEISYFCTQLTTITPQLILNEGISFSAAIEILLTKYKSNRNVFASWGDYDRKSFEKNCKWNNVEYPFANMHLNVKSLFAAKFGWNGGVEKCADSLGLTFEGTQHRGVDDSRMIAKILLKLL